MRAGHRNTVTFIRIKFTPYDRHSFHHKHGSNHVNAEAIFTYGFCLIDRKKKGMLVNLPLLIFVDSHIPNSAGSVHIHQANVVYSTVLAMSCIPNVNNASG